MIVIAVDVGTTSVRLALVEFEGPRQSDVRIIASHEKDISHEQIGLQFEQSSREIWDAVCECNMTCLKKSGINPGSIKSIAFSSTCSLVIHHNISIDSRDIIMWMDHRATNEANEVTRGKSKVLDQFGGVCSPEFSLSKLLWLKRHKPDLLKSADALFELPDWLVYQCIGGNPIECPRSLCSLTCKWGFDADSFTHCGIIQSFEKDLQLKIGQQVMRPGTISGFLSLKAAEELGIVTELHNIDGRDLTKITVGTSLIDAHSGMLAMLSIPLQSLNINLTIASTFCSLAGTSSCHMLLSKDRNFTSGIWGPYKDVILKDFFLLEAGQSLTGKLIEISISSTQEGKKQIESGKNMKQIISELNGRITAANRESSLHILPTYHGSRSPLANPNLRGGIYGLTAEGPCSLLEHYIATIESIVFELKSIIEVLKIKPSAILVSGGLMKNTFYMQTLADVLQCAVVKTSLENVDFMVMGSALTARHAALSRTEDGRELTKDCQPLTIESIKDIKYGQLVIESYSPDTSRYEYLAKKYSCYKEFVELSKKLDKILNSGTC